MKELSRSISKPTYGDMGKLKRLGRYLVNKGRVVQPMNYQPNTNYLDVWVDTDFAGCLKTRKSTSGGIITIGGHIIKAWSDTQGVIALSSGVLRNGEGSIHGDGG